MTGRAQPRGGPARRDVDEILAAVLAGGATVRGAAEIAGVAEVTVRRRLASPAFREAVREERRRILERIEGGVVAGACEAVGTLRAILTDPDTLPRDRIRCAVALLRTLTDARLAVAVEDVKNTDEEDAVYQEALSRGPEAARRLVRGLLGERDGEDVTGADVEPGEDHPGENGAFERWAAGGPAVDDRRS